ncbi:hypothetical protein Taro_050935 [Colocasia esculenta]|uniref:Dof zinc finger protein n=1 Tax=Colocasia esculenta TaxID=4460 RepID=A0A843XFA9_COLES|nr:hypothetical protein [Colocasia esculenta]
MQDLRSIPGGAAGRLFPVPGGGGAAGVVGTGAASVGAAAAAAAGALDRRLRPHPQQNLRCPRCDSLNTKFCYYNNYNLSQPRHFCKSCRRYWTKGGVLRNVPVGGGCRKSKRSSSSKVSKSSSNGCKDNRRAPPAAPATASSSDSSSLTANAAEAPAVTQDTSTPPPPPADLDFYATALLDSINEGTAPPTTAGIFPENGSFTSLIAAVANPDMMGLHFGSPPELHLTPVVQQPKATLPQPRTGLLEDEIGMPGIPVMDRYVDQIAHIEYVLPPPAQGRSAAGPPLATLDWPRGVDTPGLFEADVDRGGYWNQSQWGEIDPSLFLP